VLVLYVDFRQPPKDGPLLRARLNHHSLASRYVQTTCLCCAVHAPLAHTGHLTLPWLAVLGNPETDWPPFTASITIELWHNKKIGQSANSTSVFSATSGTAGNLPRRLRARTLINPLNSSTTNSVADVMLDRQKSRLLVRVLYNKEPLRLTSTRHDSRTGGQSLCSMPDIKMVNVVLTTLCFICCCLDPGVWMPLPEFLDLLHPYAATDKQHQLKCEAGHK
jgi:hypothetical protein